MRKNQQKQKRKMTQQLGKRQRNSRGRKKKKTTANKHRAVTCIVYRPKYCIIMYTYFTASFSPAFWQTIEEYFTHPPKRRKRVREKKEKSMLFYVLYFCNFLCVQKLNKIFSLSECWSVKHTCAAFWVRKFRDMERIKDRYCVSVYVLLLRVFPSCSSTRSLFYSPSRPLTPV